MVIVRKDFETKEIEIQGFRKILKDPKHPNHKELKIYIKNGWIPVDTEDDEKEMQKAKKRKQVLKENKARRPKYVEMEKNLQKLIKDKKIDSAELENFNSQKAIKNNYAVVLKWYNEIIKNAQNETNAEPQEDKK